jgi:hypothetical protein
LHHDLARHLWDESRHSQFGYRQLPKLGVDLMTLEHSLDLYNILVHMPPHERYAMMTMEFEAGSFPTRAMVMDRVRERERPFCLDLFECVCKLCEPRTPLGHQAARGRQTVRNDHGS